MGFFFVATRRQSEDCRSSVFFRRHRVFVAAADAEKQGLTKQHVHDVRFATNSGNIAASHLSDAPGQGRPFQLTASTNARASMLTEPSGSTHFEF